MAGSGGKTILNSAQYPRYKVAHFSKLRGKIDRTFSEENLVNISLGGAGFYFVREGRDERLRAGKRVFCQFVYEDLLDQPLEIQGNIIHSTALIVSSKQVLYYGVQFIPDHQKLVEPIIGSLEELHRAGQIEVT
jgi:hypothetical protein